MIIRATFNDNDYTMVLENYFDKFFFKNCYSALDNYDKDDVENLKIWIEKHDKIEILIENSLYNEDNITQTNIREFEKLIKESILAYADNSYLCDVYTSSEHESIMEYLKKSLKVKIIKQVKDKWENGEVVYYFLNQKKYITM